MGVGMDWQQIELMVHARAYKARYRILGDMLEVDWNGSRRAQSIGAVRPEIAAANGLRGMILRAAERLH